MATSWTSRNKICCLQEEDWEKEAEYQEYLCFADSFYSPVTTTLIPWKWNLTQHRYEHNTPTDMNTTQQRTECGHVRQMRNSLSEHQTETL